MKIAFKISCIVGVLCVLMSYSGCKPNNPSAPSVADQQIELLKTPWTVTAVTLDGVDKMTDYGSFQMSFTGTAGSTNVPYSTTGRTASKYPWATSGTLTFDATSPATTLLRDDGVTVTYAVSTAQLTMSFNYQGVGFPARTQVVQGQWSFTLAH